jgi:NAD(P)-dependent dehydrogenase (short-subunit alcohol dehydrogenase family)
LPDSVQNSRPLAGKTALVTGAARGVGKAMAIELGRLGATVVVSARTVETTVGALAGTIGATVAAIEATGSTGHPVQADLLDPASTAHLIDDVLDRFGGIDILVNNAADTGDRVFQGFWDTNSDSWRQQFELNVFAMYRLMQAFAPGMRERGHGFIVNIGSARDIPEGLGATDSIGGLTIGAAYPASKVAVYAMTTLLASELAAANIVALTLTPGAARTERFEDHASRLGFDPKLGIPPELAAQALSHILLAAEPMQYAGRFIAAPDFVSAL